MPKESKKPMNWSRLDNAAIIFPPTAHGANTGVYRLSCELTEPVDAARLQEALDDTLLRFPHIRMVLRRGVFWYYLEQTMLAPEVMPETRPPCAPLYEGSRSLLFAVTWWRHKINLDMFHVLADGAGAIAFFEALVTDYLTRVHPEVDAGEPRQAALSARGADSFQKYYEPGKRARQISAGRAYRLRGARRGDGGLNILEGVCDVRQVLDAAHRHGTTLTVYLAAVLFSAIHEEMYVRHEKRPVVLTVPVDLRGYFPSDTTRNFFSTIRVAYSFKDRPGTFEDILEATAAAFKHELTPERLAARMNQLAALEHNFLLRPIPLVLKNPVLRISGDIADLGETAALSNVGKFRLPEALHAYVKGFGAFMSTRALQLCTCTFGSSLHFCFTSAFESTETQRRFFAQLTAAGVDLEIRSNEYHEEGPECSTAPTAT